MHSTTNEEIYSEVAADWLQKVNSIVAAYEAGIRETAHVNGYRITSALPPREDESPDQPAIPMPDFFGAGHTVDMEAVKKILRGVPEKRVNAIVTALKPFPLELYVYRDHRFNLLIQAKETLLNRYVKDVERLGSVVSMLKKRSAARPLCPDVMRHSLEAAAKHTEYALRFATTYRDFLENGPLSYVPSILDSKGNPKNPQKLEYWREVLGRAIPLIKKEIAHSWKLGDERHYYLAARLLKALYPTIWPEAAAMIAKRIRDRLSK